MIRRSKFLRNSNKITLPYNILFFGSDEYSATCLRTLLLYTSPKSIDCVIPFTGSKAIESIANKHKLLTFKAPAKTLKTWKVPKSMFYDLAIVISFGYFIPSFLLKEFRVGLNVHPSLLPRYRGSSPIQYTILNQDKNAGVSIIELSPHAFDSGKILKQKQISITHPVSYTILHERLASEGASLLLDVLADLEYHCANSIDQDEDAVSKAPKITTGMALIDWNLMTAKDIYIKYLAIGEKIPLFSFFDGKKIQFTVLENPDLCSMPFGLMDSTVKPGSVYYDRHKLPLYMFVKARDDWVCIKKLRVQDKKESDPKNFYNGYGSNIFFRSIKEI